MRNSQRQSERELRADTQLAFNLEISSHQSREIAADRETEPAAGGDTCEPSGTLHERLEDRLELCTRNPRAGVDHVDCRALSNFLAFDPDRRLGRTELHRIGQEV